MFISDFNITFVFDKVSNIPHPLLQIFLQYIYSIFSLTNWCNYYQKFKFHDRKKPDDSLSTLHCISTKDANITSRHNEKLTFVIYPFSSFNKKFFRILNDALGKNRPFSRNNRQRIKYWLQDEKASNNKARKI